MWHIYVMKRYMLILKADLFEAPVWNPVGCIAFLLSVPVVLAEREGGLPFTESPRQRMEVTWRVICHCDLIKSYVPYLNELVKMVVAY